MTESRFSDRGDRSQNGERSEHPRRYISRPKFCQFCSDKNLVIDYKNVELMSRYINETGKYALAAKLAPVPNTSVRLPEL